MTSLTRGPLPSSVYWRRRLAVLSVGLLVAVGVGNALGDGSDGSDPGQAAVVAAEGSPDAAAETVTVLPSAGASLPAGEAADAGADAGADDERPQQNGERGKRATSTEPVLAEPQGRCDSADVAVTPEVPEAVAGRDVEVVLDLRTLFSPACTWRVSPSNLTLNITSGSDGIWSTRECPRALPTEDVVLRNNVTTAVTVTWGATRMDEECVRIREWALPGYYYATAAALGGEPSDVQFELEAPRGPSGGAAADGPKRR